MSEPKRQLAAIMFTDIVGYTKLMGEDEEKAMRILDANKRIHENAIKKFNGKLLKLLGDGVLVSFNTVSEAIYCAGEILNNVSREDFQISFGVHEGEIIYKDGDVFGDGVNIASRIAELASAGEIKVSESAYFNVKNKEGITGQFSEEALLKNVDQPVKIYSVEVLPEVFKNFKGKRKRSFGYTGIVVIFSILLVGIWYIFPFSGSSEISQKSIAILPLRNLTGNESEEYLSDGMTEEIIYRLSQVAGFSKVISSTSVQEYKNTVKKISEIADELGVAYILEGSFQKIGNQVKITVKLIDGINDNEVWSESFPRSYVDIFEIQSEVALRIAASLKTELASDEEKLLEKEPTKNVEAWEFYRSGVDYVRRATQKWGENPGDQEEFYIAIQQFDKAIALDSQFAMAYLGKAKANKWVYRYGIDHSVERRKVIEDNIDIAKTIDPDGAMVLYEEASFQYVERNYDQAMGLFKNITNKFPNMPDGYLGQALILRRSHRWEESLNLLGRVIELDPRSFENLDVAGETARYSRKYEIATEAFQKMLEIVPDDKLTRYHLSRINLEWKGILPDVQSNPLDHYYFSRDWEKFSAAIPKTSYFFDSQFAARPLELTLALANYLSKQGNIDSLTMQAITILNDTSRIFRKNGSLAIAYALINQQDSAMFYANKVLELEWFERDSYTSYLVEQDLAAIYMLLGNYDLLFPKLEWLLSNSGANPFTVEVLKLDPLYDPVRNDPRFIELLERPEFQVKPKLELDVSK